MTTEVDVRIAEGGRIISCVIRRHFAGFVRRHGEDMHADAILGLWRAAKTFDTARCGWKTWASRCARYAILDGLRLRGFLPRPGRKPSPRPVSLSCLGFAAENIGRPDNPARGLQWEDLVALVRRRSGLDRAVVDCLLGVPQFVVAQRLGVCPTGIGPRVVALVAELREILAERKDEFLPARGA